MRRQRALFIILVAWMLTSCAAVVGISDFSEEDAQGTNGTAGAGGSGGTGVDTSLINGCDPNLDVACVQAGEVYIGISKDAVDKRCCVAKSGAIINFVDDDIATATADAFALMRCDLQGGIGGFPDPMNTIEAELDSGTFDGSMKITVADTHIPFFCDNSNTTKGAIIVHPF